jgi:putative ABC transport system permease protein
MKLSKNIFLSFEILAAHKLRTLLSILGIVVGVGTVILMVSAGEGVEKRVLSAIQNMGTNLIVVNAGQTRIMAGRKRQITVITTLVPQDAEAIVRNCPSVASAAPAVSKKLSARWESQYTNTNVYGMTTDAFHIRNVRIASGRFFDPEEERARRRVAVIGPTVALNLFEGADPVGLHFRIGRVTFEVIGVTKPKGVDANGLDQDDLIIIPLQTAMRRVLNITHIHSIYVQAETTDSLDRAESEIRELLRRLHRLKDKPDDFTIQNQTTLLETERETTRDLTLRIGSVAAISLLVGGIGILAVMLISVGERTREIGLRRALGALRPDIRNQFLIEAVILAGAGGILGVATGVLTALVLPELGYWETVISWPAVGLSFTFSVALGIVFGVYPAVRASGLEPIEALRAE